MEGNHEAPDWSPDGQRFVFDSDLDVAELVHASINLYFMEADGSNHRRFLSGAESPRWSPDGKTIAFNSRRTGYWQVFLVNADGSGLRQLTRGRYDARYPAWSPDGQWIAFAGNEEGHWELYAIPVQGGEPMRLTAGSGDSTYPSWGP
jgi:Tol biopolymer transport system component